MADDALINRLIHDSTFGILTRQGLEYKMGYESLYNCLFIDFESVRCMNTVLGYKHVNSLLKSILSTFHYPDTLIGRLFSGDEIVILTRHDNAALIELAFYKHVAGEMSYRYDIINNIVTLEDIESRLSLRVN